MPSVNDFETEWPASREMAGSALGEHARQPSLRRTNSISGPTMPNAVFSVTRSPSPGDFSRSMGNVLASHARPKLSRINSNLSGLFASTTPGQPSLSRRNSTMGSGGSKRRIVPVPPTIARSNSASGGSTSRKHTDKQLSIKSRYSNKSNKSARHDDDQLYAREQGEVEVEELGSRVTEQGIGDAVKLSSRPRAEWVVADDSPDTVSRPASPSPSKLRTPWTTPTAILHRGFHSSANYRLVSWLGVLFIHVVCTVLYACFAAINAKLPHTELRVMLPKYSPELRRFSEFSTVVCAASSVLTSIHGAASIRMVRRSLASRQLMYYAPNFFSASRSDQIMPFSASMRALTTTTPANPRAPTKRSVLKNLVIKCWWMFQETLWARRELVVLDYTGPSERMYRLTIVAQTIVHLREVVAMSRLVLHCWLHYTYVVLIVVNAWLPFLLTLLRNGQIILWHSHRIASLVSSSILDGFGALVVPVSIIQWYSSDYDVSLGNFDSKKWLCDRWLVKMQLEVHFLLAMNALHSILRLLMGLHLLSSLNALKSLLESVTSSRPPIPSTERSISGSPTKTTARQMKLIKVKPGARRSFMLEVLLLVGGMVVLAGHLDAQSQLPNPVSCPLALRPWFTSSPFCPLVELNCASNTAISQVDGAIDVGRVLVGIDEKSVRHLLIRRCPDVLITSSIHNLPRLIMIRIRDSAIYSWPADAALTQTLHPAIHRVAVINVTLSEIPPGLLSRDFPHSLVAIDFCETNLSSLPADLNETWSRVDSLTLELSGLSDIPDVVLRMNSLVELSLRGNNLSVIPVELLEKSNLRSLNLGDNPIARLPLDVHETSLELLVVDSTKLQAVPTWAASKSDLKVIMGSTPFCESVDTTTTDLKSMGIDCSTLRSSSMFPLLSSS